MANKDEFEVSPEICFPNDGGDWELVKLSKLLRERYEKNDGKCEVFSVSVHKGFVNQVEHLGRSYSAADTSNYNLVRPFDIVYTKSPTGEFPYGIVKQSMVSKNVVISPLYGVFEPINELVGRYIATYFESPARANLYLAPIIKKGAKNTIQITNETFISELIPFPKSASELKKVVDCIAAIDELVLATGSQLKALQDHKAALIQRLIPKRRVASR